MGLPWPPTYDEGAGCPICHATIFSNRTPIFIYAFGQGMTKCGDPDPPFGDPNGVIRMTQEILHPCMWTGNKLVGIDNYGFNLFFTNIRSYMTIQHQTGARVFYDRIDARCQDHFVNEWSCGLPDLPIFDGGTVDCFW